jgi:hypothetical protein
MDGKLLYLILLQLSLWAAGAGIVSLWVLLRYKFPRWWAYFLAKVSLTGIIGFLMLIVLQAGQVEASGRAYVYMGLVLIGAIGLTFVSSDLARRGGRKEANAMTEKAKEEAAHARVSELEQRVTVEEARNTAIEVRAEEHKEGTESDPANDPHEPHEA